MPSRLDASKTARGLLGALLLVAAGVPLPVGAQAPAPEAPRSPPPAADRAEAPSPDAPAPKSAAEQSGEGSAPEPAAEQSGEGSAPEAAPQDAAAASPSAAGASSPQESEASSQPAYPLANGGQTPGSPPNASAADRPRKAAGPPRPNRFVVGAGVQGEWRADRGYERFDSQGAALAHVVAGADLLRLSGRYVLALELSTEQGRQQGASGVPSGDMTLRTQHYGAALVPRVSILPWLALHLRAGAGALRSMLRVDAGGDTLRDQDVWGYAVDLAGGVAFVLPRDVARRGEERRPLPVGPLLRLEAGYRFAEDASFGSRELDPEDSLATEQPSLGTLERGAAFLRVLLALRF